MLESRLGPPLILASQGSIRRGLRNGRGPGTGESQRRFKYDPDSGGELHLVLRCLPPGRRQAIGGRIRRMCCLPAEEAGGP
jgi:hypothetical protein